MINFLGGEIGKAQELVKAGMVLIGIGFIGHQWVTKKALVPVLGSILMLGIVTFAIFNVNVLHGWIKTETSNSTTSFTKATFN